MFILPPSQIAYQSDTVNYIKTDTVKKIPKLHRRMPLMRPIRLLPDKKVSAEI
jgi:hypothetical protein